MEFRIAIVVATLTALLAIGAQSGLVAKSTSQQKSPVARTVTIQPHAPARALETIGHNF